MTSSGFDAIPLLPSLQRTLAEVGFTDPTEVQALALPGLLAGRGTVAVAETGSGKTLAYGLALLDRLKRLELDGDAVRSGARPRGLVVVPGRELGEQVAAELKRFTHDTRLRVRVALGGTRKAVSRERTAGPFEVLVATPGRLEQLLDDALTLDDLRLLVFDEADELLDPGFLPAARRLVAAAPDGVQLVVVSATLPPRLDHAVGALFPEPPARIQTAGSGALVPSLTVVRVAIAPARRLEALADALDEAAAEQTILFVNSRAQAADVGTWLDRTGYAWVPYMGEMDPVERRRNLRGFRAGEVPLLLTTDLGARGLDIDDLERVINVYLPHETSRYLHRAGRTARAGREGTMVDLVAPSDRKMLRQVVTAGPVVERGEPT